MDLEAGAGQGSSCPPHLGTPARSIRLPGAPGLNPSERRVSVSLVFLFPGKELREGAGCHGPAHYAMALPPMSTWVTRPGEQPLLSTCQFTKEAGTLVSFHLGFSCLCKY